ncbi:hypothetical protein X798_07700 [Onchocerca flexuosa]|uniref:Uncharacterized protein n=1 Tax=Onchocerca flexuosa TaxID=387005 RepID=A0A238BJR0_9BILA|nr:hypothetical protein X798_07700 [Onchocerca flexuosa]
MEMMVGRLSVQIEKGVIRQHQQLIGGKKRNLRRGFRNLRKRKRRRYIHRTMGWIWYIATIYVQTEPTTTNRR